MTTTTSISFTWDQPDEEFVDSYEIKYTYDDECIDVSHAHFTIRSSNSSLRSFTITNSPNTPVEDGSNYLVGLYAVNASGRSASTGLSSLPFKTLGTGIAILMCCE